MKHKILQKIPTECPWRDTLYWYEATNSTNDLAKGFAKEGAAHGTVILAGTQTGGRGRMGRSFLSPEGGLYLSVILRPKCPATELMHLTCATGVATSDAVEQIADFRPGIKWINDLVWSGKKLGGILTELSLDAKTGLVDYAVIGIGINCREPEGGFPSDIADIAVSLSGAAGKDIDPAAAAAALITALWKMDMQLLSGKKALMDTYRSLCVTLGKQILVLRGSDKRPGKALDVNDDGGLVVEYGDGYIATVSSGEVSVRGMWDYV